MCLVSKFLLTKNLKQAANLVHRSVGIIKDIIYAEKETLANNLHMYVIVDFGDTYTGKLSFGDDPDKRGWVPIKPMVAGFLMYDSNEYVEHTGTQILLKF